VGRKVSDTKQEFEVVLDVGARCRHCSLLVRSKKQNGTLLASHLFNCKSASWSVKQQAWDTCLTLRNTKPRPTDPAAARVSPVLPPSGIGAAGSSKASTLPAPASQISSPNVLNYMDRITCDQADVIDAAIMNFFVLNCVPFSTVESESFIALLKVLRPAYVARKKVPSRKRMAGTMLSQLHETTREQVLRALADWCRRRKAVLMLDGWENVKHHHIVNLLAMIGDTDVFLDSIYCGDDCQDAAGQAQLVQEQLAKYGGMDTFNAVASDNTASCIEMRRLVVSAHPGMVSLNDQAHVANLLVGDLCKVGWVASCVSKALLVTSYVRRHTRLLAAYTAAKDSFNRQQPPGAAAEKQTAVEYPKPCSTRFLFTRDLLVTCARNRPALRNLVECNNGAEVPRLVKMRNENNRQSQAAFLRVAESAADARDWLAASRILDPVCRYLRLFDSQSGRLSLVLPATTQLRQTMGGLGTSLRATGSAGTASAEVFSQVTAAVDKRMSGPVERSVRVLLLDDIHFLATALDPAVFDAHADDVTDVVDRAFDAVRTFFLRSPAVFTPSQLEKTSDEQRMILLRQQFTTYAGLSGTFAKGAFAARIPGSAVGVAHVMASNWDPLGWWVLYGSSAPELREIGKAVAGMVPSSCPVERSFSVQKSIHTLVRNRLAHDKVAMLMFLHTNLSFLSGREVLGDHPGFLESLLDDVDGEEGARSDEDWSGESGGEDASGPREGD